MKTFGILMIWAGIKSDSRKTERLNYEKFLSMLVADFTNEVCWWQPFGPSTLDQTLREVRNEVRQVLFLFAKCYLGSKW